MIYPITYYVLPTVLILIVVRKYRESKWGKCKNNIKLNGKIAIVTGANSGIGLEIARELSSRYATVILACRNLDKAKETCEYIKANCSNDPDVVPLELDLASLCSVKNFVDIVKKNFKKIDLLINNAGVSFPSNKDVKTLDGFEIHFGVNHLGHFFLTNELLELLSASSTPSRVVIVASSLHERGQINLDDLNSLKRNKKTNLYANSKLANIYFAQELSRRTDKKNINVYACCPGWVYTGLFRHSVKWYHYVLIAPIAFFFMRSPKQGAQTPVYCATEPELEAETGLLYRDCKHYNSGAIFYDSIASKLWDQSETMIAQIVKKDQ